MDLPMISYGLAYWQAWNPCLYPCFCQTYFSADIFAHLPGKRGVHVSILLLPDMFPTCFSAGILHPYVGKFFAHAQTEK